MNITYCYSDASYSPQTGLAVTGYKIGADGEIWISRPKVTGIAEAEKLGINSCIDAARAYDVRGTIVLFTDHEGALKMAAQPAWKERFPDVELRVIKGHKKGTERDEHDERFREVDRMVRRILREDVKKV